MREATSSEFLGQELVHQRGIGLAFGGAHHLADEISDDGLLAPTILFELLGTAGDDLIDNLLNGRGVGDLLRFLFLVDGGKILAARRGVPARYRLSTARARFSGNSHTM